MSTLAARLLPALVFCALVPSFARGQGSTASLAGVVRDEQNLVVPGASVTMAGVEARGDPVVRENIELVADDERRRRQRRAARQRPGDVRSRHVAATVGAHGDEPRLLKASRDEHQAVAEDHGTFENPSSSPTRQISRPVSGS